MMNRDMILSLIDKEIEKLNLVFTKGNTELEFLDKVLTENSFNNIDGLVHTKEIDVITAFLCASSKKYSYEEIRERVLLNEALFKIKNDFVIAQIYDCLKARKNNESVELKDNIFFLVLAKENSINMKSLEELYENNGDKLLSIQALIRIITEIKDDYMIYDRLISEETSKGTLKFSAKERKAVISSGIHDEYKISTIKDQLFEIQSYYSRLKANDRKMRKDAKKSISDYSLAKRMLTGKNKDIDIDKLLPLIRDDEIKKLILIGFNSEQKEKYDKLYNEYLQLSKNNSLQIQALFNDYKFDYNLSKQAMAKVLYLPIDELRTYLDCIKKLNINDCNLINYIFINSTHQVLNNVISLIKDGYVSCEFILNNRSFLSIENVDNNYFKLINLLELWKVEGINPRIFINDLSIYLNDVNIIRTNINVLKNYNLFSNIRKLSKFSLLTDFSLVRKIDMLLELGYESVLEEDLSILNRDINDIRKLYVLKGMNLLPTDKTSLVTVIDNNKFLTDKNLDSYIFNAVDYKLDREVTSLVLDKHQDYLNDVDFSYPRTVLIGGVLFSLNKIKRNKRALKELGLDDEKIEENAALISSVLSEEEYDVVVSEIRKKQLEKKI